ncbi:MAG TPA: hypothetical protein VM755_06410 [Stellaceae bacterium]|nr:hypothetical protein [Stellaceae bacterium]
MWSLTSEDLRLARQSASRRRTEIEERYSEELRTLDAELSEIDAMERLAGEFASKHLRAEAAVEAAAPAEPESESESTPDGPAGSIVEGRNGSRWRLHFGSPAGAEETAQS